MPFYGHSGDSARVLGNVVSSKGLEVDTAKIEVINLPTLKTMQDVRSRRFL